MSSLLCALSLLLASALAVSASNHACCQAAAASFDTGMSGGEMCTMAKCNAAARFLDHSEMVQFMDGCRSFKDLQLTITFAKCFAKDMPRGHFHAFATDRSNLEDELNIDQMKANIASLVMAYGCTSTARSQRCLDGLNHAIFVEHHDAILGIERATFTNGPVSLTATVNNLIASCVSPPGSFNNSEYENGMAECAAVGTDGTIGQHIVNSSSPIAVCKPCTPWSTTEQPFCKSFFLQGKSGARCGSARIADRVAQTYYTRWNRTGTVSFGATQFKLPDDQGCHILVSEMACRATIVECDANSKLRTVCTTECENRLMADCSVSESDATSICQTMGAADCSTVAPTTPTTAPTTGPTTATTTAPTTAATRPTETPKPNTQLQYTFELSDQSPTGNEFNVTFCFGHNHNKSMEVLLQAVMETPNVTKLLADHMKLINRTSHVDDNDQNCVYRVTLTLIDLSADQSAGSRRRRQAPSQDEVEKVRTAISNALGLTKENVTTALKNVRIPVLVAVPVPISGTVSGTISTESGQASLSAAVALVIASLCASLYLH